MSYTSDIGLLLGSARPALAEPSAQLVDTTGASVGAAL
jgi:hypothetical protein